MGDNHIHNIADLRENGRLTNDLATLQTNEQRSVFELNLNSLSTVNKIVVQEKLKNQKEKFNHVTENLTKPFKARTRFYILVLVLFCLASIWSNILCFNFAIICIKPPVKESSTPTSNDVSKKAKGDSDGVFSNDQNNYLTMAVAIGALIANFPVVLAVNRFGIRTVFPICGFVSMIATALLPLAISEGFDLALIARFCQGVAFACNFPTIGMFNSKWTYFKQNGLFVSTLVAFIQLSPTLTNPISGALCTSSLGWKSVFYGHAIVTLVLFTLFVFLYRNTPAKHPLVTKTESNKIAVGKSSNLKAASNNIPYWPIVKTLPVWAIWIAALGNFYCVNLVFLYQPTYLSKVLKFSVSETGASAAVPPLIQFVIKLLSGFVSDKVNLSVTSRIEPLAAFGLAAMFLVILGFIPPEQRILCFVLLVAAEGCLGIATGGFFKNGSLIAKDYNSFVTGNISLGIMITMLIVPLMVNSIDEYNNQAEWRLIFIITAGVLVGTNIIFVIIGSAQPSYWTKEEFLCKQIAKHRRSTETGTQTSDEMERGVPANEVE
uniref:Major facilitator superfamily (MFS) profile domain-containing protein n=1 Tax=Acrobeloides nanus TaxID=290746 RepID=A0A914EMZ1_9BILA